MNEAEANLWLHRYLVHYNNQPHRSEPHSRLDDWLANLPETGVREMCSWERFCAFAREPERRKVGSNARLTVEGTVYEVDPDLAGEPKLTRHGYDVHNLARAVQRQACRDQALSAWRARCRAPTAALQHASQFTPIQRPPIFSNEAEAETARCSAQSRKTKKRPKCEPYHIRFG